MFDVGASELLVIVIVAVLVIGPKDLPLALRTAGRWIGKIRRVSAQFRTGFDAMVREAEMEDMEKKWKEQNARIMAEHPGDASAEGAAGAADMEMTPLPATGEANAASPQMPETSNRDGPTQTADGAQADEPVLPLGKPEAK